MTMHIIEDTRQKDKMHEAKHQSFEEMGVSLIRCALPFGDYTLPPTISVDTKRNMQEIAGDLVGDHARFRNECIKAQEAGCHLYMLIETEWEDINSVDDVHVWYNPRLIYSRRAVTGEKLEKIMHTMEEKYNVRFMFCRPNESAAMVMKILNGDFEDG